METKEQVKLVKSENGGEEYHILINRVIGKGGFGTVYEARPLENYKQRLVVKTMKIQSPARKKAIQNQLKIMSELPPHQNLVKVIPVKTYSANNYYMFMEYCEGGTLYQQYTNKKNHFYEEEEFYDIFYQCMNGYKVLFDKKILHQDIKPENVLIRKNVYKLADFGLSIFYEGYDFGDSRQGTLTYIAPEKLTVRNYVGNPKSDVYSFGVMFYQLVVGYHPYVKTTGRKGNYKEFMRELISSKLRYPGNLPSRFSLRFHEFFDLILKMVKKTEAGRISFQQVWDYIKNNDIFEKSRQKQKQISKQFLIEEYDFVVSEITNVLTLPVDASDEQEENLRKEYEEKLKEENSKLGELGKQVATYFIRRRLIVYYLDRLARKLIVEELKQNAKSDAYDRTVLYLMLFTKALLNDLVTQLKVPKAFTSESLIAFRKTHQLASDITSLLRRDHQYVDDSLCQLLSQPSLPKKEVKQMFQLYKQNDQQNLIKNLSKSLHELLASKIDFIQVTNKSHLVTLVNIITISQMLDNFSKAIQNAEELQISDKKVLMSTTPELIGLIQNKCSEKGMMCGFDMTGVYQEEEGLVFEN